MELILNFPQPIWSSRMRLMQEFFVQFKWKDWGMSQKGLMGNNLFPSIQTLAQIQIHTSPALCCWIVFKALCLQPQPS